MAEIPMSGHGAVPAQARNFAPLISLTGAAVSLALVVGTGIWGYKLLMRDVSGVPVVRAVDGPMRIAPENPGGLQADNQGLAVNSVAAEGIAAKPADRLVLAPPPVSLTQDDQAVTLANLPKVTASSIDLAPQMQSAVSDEIVAPPLLKTDQIAAIDALADELASGVEPLGDVEPVTVKVPDQADLPSQSITQGMVNRSLRPHLRPAKPAVPTASTEIASADAPTIPVGPVVTPDDMVPAGTRMVQLGAFASPEIAVAEWDKLTGQFEQVLEGKSRVIQKASSGGKVFYRLRAMGFSDLSDARRLCSALKAERADCIPVVAR